MTKWIYKRGVTVESNGLIDNFVVRKDGVILASGLTAKGAAEYASGVSGSSTCTESK